jgi:hypothetical protein
MQGQGSQCPNENNQQRDQQQQEPVSDALHRERGHVWQHAHAEPAPLGYRLLSSLRA